MRLLPVRIPHCPQMGISLWRSQLLLESVEVGVRVRDPSENRTITDYARKVFFRKFECLFSRMSFSDLLIQFFCAYFCCQTDPFPTKDKYLTSRRAPSLPEASPRASSACPSRAGTWRCGRPGTEPKRTMTLFFVISCLCRNSRAFV